ncbi:unnamed protein product [Larinioides sclopetarius]|uniref:Uncharacterized protein n=1 Tax=Larinioides sclopetarius TaxID=280406 RepID=A0AAV1YWM7_9ARAC
MHRHSLTSYGSDKEPKHSNPGCLDLQ